jgi:poly(glycerol-phosphate) alpha-glucosyltransferase
MEVAEPRIAREKDPHGARRLERIAHAQAQIPTVSAMPPTDLPEGRYFSCAWRVTTDAGGQTRALLMRNRILAQEGGVRPEVLTVGAAPDYPERRAILRDQGLLIDELRLRNIYEHYRDHGWGDETSTGVELADLGAHKVREDESSDGAPWRTVYMLPGAKLPIYEYLRADGSPFLRIPSFSLTYKRTWPDRIQQIGADGHVVGEFNAVGQWFRHWIRELLGEDKRAFIFMDSRFVVPHVVPMRGRRFHLLYQMHNVHVAPPRRWDSELDPVYRRVLGHIDGMDAMVTLTERQREDIAERRGRTSNMFVIPNPVPMPPAPGEAPPRNPCRVSILARLEPQKRLTDAIAAFSRVVEAVPNAHLDIYGDGSDRPRLEAEIENRGLGGSVALRGFDPRAPDALWSSSAFLLTSSFEGYPLSTLESMARGCPVVAYDIKYGPREQITDGVDGFLVPAGDVDQLADRVIALLSSPDLVRRMSTAARERARSYGPPEYLVNWAGVLHATVEHKRLRTRLENIALEGLQLRPASFGRLRFAGLLRVKGRSRKSELDTATIELAAIDDASGTVTALPIRVKHGPEGFELRARIKLGDVFAGGDEAWLRLRFTWRNSSWETEVARLSDAGGLEITLPDGAAADTPPHNDASARAAA